MIDRIRTILAEYNPKSYAKVLKKYPDIVAWINTETDQYSPASLNERLYILLVAPPATMPCGKYPAFNTFTLGYRKFCGSRTVCSCAQLAHAATMTEYHQQLSHTERTQRLEKTKATNLERYGVSTPSQNPAVRDLTQATNYQRYGAAYPLQSSEVQARVRATNIERYGVEYPLQSSAVQEKVRATSIERYGEDYMRIARQAFLDNNRGQNPFVVHQAKIKQAIKRNYGVDYPMQCDAIKQRAATTLESNFAVRNPAQLHINTATYAILEDPSAFAKLCEQHSLKNLAEYLGVSESVIWNQHTRYELEYYTKSTRSQYEEEIAAWLCDLGVTFVRNTKVGAKTVDFLINNSVAIEFNGLYAHSEYSYYGKKLGATRYYHRQKLTDCEAAGYRLFTIFEDEWNSKKLSIKNQIKISLGLGSVGVSARKTQVQPINNVAALAFLEQYHLQGGVNSSVYLGCYADSTLIAVMTFLKKQPHEWELTRFASDDAVHPGVFSKMLKYFTRNWPCNTVVSFSDNRWSQGSVYRTNGFILESELKPDYFVTDYRVREHKFNWRKARIASRFGVDVADKTELELTLALKWDRIWDCGKKKWRLTLD